MTQPFTNPKRRAPTSDEVGDFGQVIVRITETIGELQKVATRMLPSRYRLEIDDEDSLVVVDLRGRRRGTITVDWKDE